MYQDWGQLSDFFFSCQHQACSIFCCCKYGKHKPWHGSLEHIPFLYGYNWTICHPFYRMPPRHWRHRLEVEYLNKDQLIPTPFAIVLVWIATKQAIGTNFKMSCLVIVKKRCHVIGTPQPTASIPLNFRVVTNQPNCWFHIVLSSKQWRQFIYCTV